MDTTTKPSWKTRNVLRVDQSPMNVARWCLTLDCGHEKWETSRRRPLKKTTSCDQCKRDAENNPVPESGR